ncbi:MAG: hypothetical protein A3E79_12105 [Burkholderiales bacterium RIFCSPHIGHO2_12_FULL_61_11]|nr:MAG: hypothetical protein A3E79_12105 [Burkholderiales bacterium RIFCSPHIGHO2_12_FULL_61_11]
MGSIWADGHSRMVRRLISLLPFPGRLARIRLGKVGTATKVDGKQDIALGHVGQNLGAFVSRFVDQRYIGLGMRK